MKKKDLINIIQEEVKKHFKIHKYSLEEELLLQNELILCELLNINNTYKYQGQKGIWEYKDINNVEFFVRLNYTPLKYKESYYEIKTGWIGDDGFPVYEPSIPPISPKSSSKDGDKRANTVAKIYKNEIIPFFKNQNQINLLKLLPISPARSRFAQMMVKKFTPKEWNIEVDKDENIIIRKNQESQP